MARKRNQVSSASGSREGEPQPKIRKVDIPATVISWEKFKDKEARKTYKDAAEKPKEEKEAYKEWKRRTNAAKDAKKLRRGSGDAVRAVVADLPSPTLPAQDVGGEGDIVQEATSSIRKSEEQSQVAPKRKEKKSRNREEQVAIDSERGTDDAENTSTKAQKRKRKRNSQPDLTESSAQAESPAPVEEAPLSTSKDQHDVMDVDVEVPAGAKPVNGDATSSRGTRKDRKHGPKSKRRPEKGVVKHSEWAVSTSTGGHMLDVDPIFSPDEE